VPRDMEQDPSLAAGLSEHATKESRPHAGQQTNGFRGDTSERTNRLVLIVEPFLGCIGASVSSSLGEALADDYAIVLSRQSL
jgi:hypothetical protein